MKEDNWISVSKELPKESENVLVFCPKGNLGEPFQCVAFRKGNHWLDADDEGIFDTPRPVTHWQPLPSPPVIKAMS